MTWYPQVVMDVGSGTGVLAIWAAQAGAKKVYAVEVTETAKHAQTMVDAHGFTDTIEVKMATARDDGCMLVRARKKAG